MTFNAGSIDAEMTLDRTPFSRGLKLAEQEAREFVDKKRIVKIGVDVDTRAAATKVREFVAAQSKHEIDIKVNADTRVARAEIDQLAAANGKAETSAKKVGAAQKKAGEDGASGVNLMLDAITLFGPELVPLASGLAGIGSSVIGIGAVAALAFKGASAEIKAGTDAGAAFSGSVNTAKGALSQLEATAAKGVLGSFRSEIAALNQELPGLNSFINRISKPVGNILGKGFDAGIHLLENAEPLIETSLAYVDKLVTRLDNWASSGGGTEFFAALANDIPIAAEAVGNLAGVIGGLLSGLEPLGTVMLQVLNGVTGVANVLTHVPGLVTAATTAFVAWRISVLLGAAAAKLQGSSTAAAAAAVTEETVALRVNTIAAEQNAAALNILAGTQARLAGAGVVGAAGSAASLAAARGAAGGGALAGAGAAEGAVAGAGAAGAMSRLKTGAAALSRAAVPLIITALASSVASQATKDWATENNRTKNYVHAGIDGVKDFFTGNWSFSDVGKDIGKIKQSQNINAMQSQYDAWMKTKQNLAWTNQGIAPTVSPMDTKTWAQFDNTRTAVRGLKGQTDSGKIAAENTRITESLQKQLEAERKLQDTSKGGMTLNNGLRVSSAAYSAELKKLGGSIDLVDNYFQDNNDAAIENAHWIQELQNRQGRYNDFLGVAATKYKLTAAQASAYGAAAGLNYQKITANNAALQDSENILGLVAAQLANGTDATRGWTDAISTFQSGEDTLTSRSNLLMAGLTALQGVTLSMAGTNLQAASGAEGAANAIEENSKSVGRNGNLLGQLVKRGKEWVVTQPKLTDGALKIQQAMTQAGTSAIQLAGSIYRNTQDAGQAYSAYMGLRAQFVATEIQAGKTAKGAENLAKQIYGVPKDAKTFVKLLGKDDVAGAIASLTRTLSDFSGTIATALAKLDADTGVNNFNGEYASITAKMANLRAGVTVPVRIHSVGDLKGTPGDSGATGPVTGPLGAPTVPKDPKGGRADGGRITVGTGPRADDVHIRVSKGEYVVNAKATDEHLSLLEAINSGSLSGYADGGLPSLITTSGTKAKSSKAASSAKKASSDKADKLQALIELLSGDLPTPQLTDFAGLFTATFAVMRATFADMNKDLAAVRKAGIGTAKDVRAYTNAERDFLSVRARSNTLAKKIDADKTLLGNVKSLRTSVSDTVTGAFDVGTSGNGYAGGILASLTQDNRDASKYASLRKQAEKLGLSKALLEKLDSEGPETAGKNLQAIVSGGKNYIAQLNAGYGQLQKTGAALGDTATLTKYNTTQAALTTKIKDETTRQTAYQKQLSKDVNEMKKIISELRKDLISAKRKA